MQVENFKEYTMRFLTDYLEINNTYLLEMKVVDLKTKSKSLEVSFIFQIIAQDMKLELYVCDDKTYVFNSIKIF